MPATADTPTTSSTQSTSTTSDPWNDYADRWRIKFTPNLWASGVDTTLGKSGREVKVDKTFLNLLDKTSLAAALNIEVGKGPVSGVLTGLYFQFKLDGSTRNGHIQAKAKLNMAIVDFGLPIQFLNVPLGSNPGADPPRLSLEFVPGFRYTYADTDSSIYLGQLDTLHPGTTDHFFDPYAGGRIRLDLNRQLNFTCVGNVGGWGVGTELTYALGGQFEYRFNPTFGVFAGYRVLYDKFDNDGTKLDLIFSCRGR